MDSKRSLAASQTLVFYKDVMKARLPASQCGEQRRYTQTQILHGIIRHSLKKMINPPLPPCILSVHHEQD